MVTSVSLRFGLIFGNGKHKTKVKLKRNRRRGSVTASVKRRIAAICEPSLLIVNQKPLGKRGSLSYADILREFTLSEEQYIRELNLLMKIFRKPFTDAPHLFSEEEVNSLFCNLSDIYELTLQFWSMIDAAREMAGTTKEDAPLLGDYFEEMAEAAEFEAYEFYAFDLTSSSNGINGRINSILSKPGVAEYLKEKNLHEAIKYILPKLLFGPVYHCLEYFEYMKLMMTTSPNEEDKEKFVEALSALRSLQVSLERKASSDAMKKRQEDRIFYQRSIGVNVPTTAAKMNEIQKSIDGWEGKDIRSCCSELLKEGHLIKPCQGGRKATERYVFLFDSLMVCVKQNTRHSITGLAGFEYRFKKKFFLRKIEIKDIDDTDEMKNAFAIISRDHPPYFMCSKTEEEKSDWMAVLLTLHLRSTLDRHLDALLAEETQSIPLCLPSPDVYCFAEEDTDETIVFEGTQENDPDIPLIKGGTLIKLVERLTYPTYADPAFVRVFLTTYRSFCTPIEFLDLLIRRFEIPEPPLSVKDQMAAERGQPIVRDDLKRFRKEYAQPIQFRVMNVLRQWVDQHYYDYERDPELLVRLQNLLESSSKSKAIKRLMDVMTKIIKRKAEFVTTREQYSFSCAPPPIEWHLTQDPEYFDIMQLHPLEIARQLTLIESEMFRLIKPSELVGSAWMKSDKDKTSPNALRMIRFSNTITYWYEKCIIDAQNFEERVAVLSRIIDILMGLEELNNFNGILEVIAALNSAPVYRLHLTFAELTPKRQQALEENRGMADSHHRKYVERLRSINPPCVPFLGMYLTNILKSEDGNPDFLLNHGKIININKRRKVAEITWEIQTYQNLPYNLETEFSIRSFLETLNPLGEMTEKEMNDFLYENSLLIEPRNQKVPPKFLRKTEIPLKSPGIKPSAGKSGGRKTSTISQASSEIEITRSPSPQMARFRSASQNSILTISESTSSLASSPFDSIDDTLPRPKLPPRIPRQLDQSEEINTKTPYGNHPLYLMDEHPEEDNSSPPPLRPRKPSRPTLLPLTPPVPPRTPLTSSGDSPLVFSPIVKRPPPPPPVSYEHELPDKINELPENVQPPPPLPPRPPKTPISILSGGIFNAEFDLPSPDSPPPAIPPRPAKTPK